MKGTVKQINWANDIKGRVEAIIDETLAHAPSADHPMAVRLNRIKAALNEETCDAGDVIELYRDVHEARDLASRFKLAPVNAYGPAVRKLFGLEK